MVAASVSRDAGEGEQVKLLCIVALLTVLAMHLLAKDKVVNLEIPPSCAKKILLKDCDLNGPMPKCKKIFVDYYPASCAIVHLE